MPPSPGALARGSTARAFLLVAGGVALATVFLDPGLWILGWVALVPLFRFAPRAPSMRSALFQGWLFGLGATVPAFYWLVETIHRFGGFPLPLALSFYAVLSAYSALQIAIVAAGLQRGGPHASLWLAPALWTAVEFLFPGLFPWRLGHSQRELTWLIQIGDLTGPYGLSFVMASLANAACAPRNPRRLLAPLALLVATAAYGGWRVAQVDSEMEAAPRFAIGIVQGNLGLDEKRHVEHFEGNVARYRRLSSSFEPPPDLLVWPETVVEWGIPRDADLTPALDPYPRAPAPLLFGAVSYRRGEGRVEWFNSAFLRAADGRLAGQYDKIVLMPFGEFIPLASWFPGLKELSPNTGDFEAGAGPAVLPVTAEARVGALICYEDLLADHVRHTVQAGATLLTTLANDAWFGTSAALEQHETLALWRAVENRRYLVRATNTGLTSVIDPVGRRAAMLPVATEATVVASVRLMRSSTPYTSFGDLFGWAAVLLAVALLARTPSSDKAAETPAVAVTRGSNA